MRDLGQQKLNIGTNDTAVPLAPITDAGSGQVQDRQKLRLTEIVAAINDLFEGDLTEGDKVSYVESLKDKLLESQYCVARQRPTRESSSATHRISAMS
jgi:type I restriction enzyme, R subunit